MNTEIKSAEEKAETFFYALRIEGILPPFDAVSKRKFIEKLAAQFTPAIVGDGVEKEAEKYYWEQKSKKRTMGVYHAVEDFKAGWQAAQEQPIKSVFPETSDWIEEFKTNWYRDNDGDGITKKQLDEKWKEHERLISMIYQYQKRAFEAQQPIKSVEQEEIKSKDSFVHLPTNKIYECMGTDEGYVWYEHPDFTELQKFDKGDCEII